MKKPVKASIFLFFLFSAFSLCYADTIYLKNGRQMEGVISKEDNASVELEVGAGKVKFYREQIDHIERSSQQENDALDKFWAEQKLQKEAELKKRMEEKEAEPKDTKVSQQGPHLFVDALINGTVKVKLLVDTGASYVVLSSKIAEQLNMRAVGPEVKMILADGKAVSGMLVKLDTISVGESQANDVMAAVIPQDKSFPGFDGLLGMSFLKLFKFEIDSEKGKLVLQKS